MVIEEEGMLKRLTEGTMVMRSPDRTRRSRGMAMAFGAMRYAYCALRAEYEMEMRKYTEWRHCDNVFAAPTPRR